MFTQIFSHKSSFPGKLQTVRYFNVQQRPIEDCTFDELNQENLPVAPDSTAQSIHLLTPVFRKGKLQSDNPKLFNKTGTYHSLEKIRETAIHQWSLFSKINKHPHHISPSLMELRKELRRINNASKPSTSI